MLPVRVTEMTAKVTEAVEARLSPVRVMVHVPAALVVQLGATTRR